MKITVTLEDGSIKEFIEVVTPEIVTPEVAASPEVDVLEPVAEVSVEEAVTPAE